MLIEEAEPQDAVYALAASPGFARDKTCFAARRSGLYRSVDGGATWQPTLGSLLLSSELLISAVAVSPDFPRDRTVFAGSSGGILRSYDGGENWHVTVLPAPSTLVSCLAFSPAYADAERGVTFAGTLEDGVYRSVNRGQSWAKWNFGLFDLHAMALAVSPGFLRDETLFAGTDTGLYVSRNGGRSWRLLAFPDELAPVLSVALSPHYAHDGVLFAGTESAGLWRSAGRDVSWLRMGDEVMCESVNAIVVSPECAAQPQLLALATEGLFLSRDCGEGWTRLATDEVAEIEPTAVVAPDGLSAGASLLVGLADGRVIRLGL